MSNHKEKLANLMVHYFKMGASGWDLDNTSEIREMTDHIEKMIESKVVEMLEKGTEAYKPKQLSNEEITFRTLMHKAYKMSGEPDDAGCDWFTDENGNTYIASPTWKVSTDPIVAQLVETAYFIRYGENVQHTKEEIEKWLKEEEELVSFL